MPTDSITLISGVLVCVGVGAKLVTTNLLARQKLELKDLENDVDRRRTQLEELEQQHVAAEENIEFYERRKEEGIEERATLEQELKGLFELERKHLASLGYDPDEEGVHAYVPGSHEEGGAEAADEIRAPAQTIAVLPADLVNADKLFLPDVMVSHLRDQGEDLAAIIEKEDYFKLGSVASATCRLIQIPSGTILLSTTYEQPGTHGSSPEYHPLTQTAQVLAESIHDVLRTKPDPAEVAPETG
jgi:hypothetical protein